MTCGASSRALSSRPSPARWACLGRCSCCQSTCRCSTCPTHRSPRPTSCTTCCPGQGRSYATHGRVSCADRSPAACSSLCPRRRHRGGSAGLRGQRPERLQTHRRGGAPAHGGGHPAVNPSESHSSDADPAEPESNQRGRLPRGNRGWHLRDRRRIDPRANPRRLGHGPQPGGPSRACEHLRHLRCGGRHLCGPPGERVWTHRPRLAARRRLWSGWIAWRLSRRIAATTIARPLLRTLLGLLAIGLAVAYAIQVAL